MIKTTIKVDGMMCGMCEAHVSDAVRAVIKAKKVSSSHSNGVTEIISEEAPDSASLKEAIEKSGYKVLDIKSEPYEKKGFFRR